MLKIFPYLKEVKIDLAWGGPMACSPNLFPQIGTLPGRSNAFLVQGYSGFGVTPSHIICKVLAEGMSEGSARYDLLSSIRAPDHYRQGRHPPAAADRRQILAPTVGLLERAPLTLFYSSGVPAMTLTALKHDIQLSELDAWGSVTDLGSKFSKAMAKPSAR